MERIDIQQMRRLQVDHRTDREAKRAEYRQQIERLRRGESLHPERVQPIPPAVSGDGGYRPHVTTPNHAPLEPDFDADPFPRELVADPRFIDAIVGRMPRR